jgi:hypothetical protein
MKLTLAQRDQFLHLVAMTGSRANSDRVMARLRLNKFVIKHGKDACQEAYDAEQAKRKKK